MVVAKFQNWFLLKRVVSISLLLIFLYNLSGYYLTFEVNRQQVRKEIKNKIKNSAPDSDLVTIRILASDQNSLFWTKKGREFRYKGDMYDVVKCSQKEDSIVYKCIRDAKETKLFADLDKHVQQHLYDNPRRTKEMQNIFKKLVQSIFVVNEPKDDLLSLGSVDLEYFFNKCQYQSITIDKLSPPPQVS